MNLSQKFFLTVILLVLLNDTTVEFLLTVNENILEEQEMSEDKTVLDNSQNILKVLRKIMNLMKLYVKQGPAGGTPLQSKVNSPVARRGLKQWSLKVEAALGIFSLKKIFLE